MSAPARRPRTWRVLPDAAEDGLGLQADGFGQRGQGGLDLADQLTGGGQDQGPRGARAGAALVGVEARDEREQEGVGLARAGAAAAEHVAAGERVGQRRGLDRGGDGDALVGEDGGELRGHAEVGKGSVRRQGRSLSVGCLTQLSRRRREEEALSLTWRGAVVGAGSPRQDCAGCWAPHYRCRSTLRESPQVSGRDDRLARVTEAGPRRPTPRRTPRCETGPMTVQTPADDLVPEDGAVHEPFDVEPPYEPDPEALEQPREVRGPLPRPRALLAALQPAPARDGRGRQPAAAGAGAVRWRSSPATSTSSSWCASPGSSAGSPPGWPSARRPGMMPRERAGGSIWSRSAEQMQRHAEFFRDEIVPALVGAGHRAGPLGRPGPRGAEVLQAVLQGPGLPGAHPAGRRPRPPVPLHLRASRSTWPSSSATPRPARSTSPGSRCRRRSAASWPLGNQRFVPLEDVIGEHLQAALPGHGGAAGPHLPGHPQRGPRGRGGRRREPARRPWRRSCCAAVRPAGPPRGRGVDHPAGARAADLRARRLAAGGRQAARPARPARASTTSPTCRART